MTIITSSPSHYDTLFLGSNVDNVRANIPQICRRLAWEFFEAIRDTRWASKIVLQTSLSAALSPKLLIVDIDDRVKAFLDRPIKGDWPYLSIDATYLEVRRGGLIVSVAVLIAVGVNADARREVLGMETGTSEAEPIWTEFLC
jgi:Transposase, Mutator family